MRESIITLALILGALAAAGIVSTLVAPVRRWWRRWGL